MASGQNFHDELNNDAKRAKDYLADKPAAAAKQIKRNVDTVKKVAENAASGNAVGVVWEFLKNPKILVAALGASFFLVFGPLLLTLTFVVSLPASIIESVDAAAQSTYDDIVLGWETWKAELGNGIDDFLTWITTGEKGDSTEAFQNDVAIASDPDYEIYVGASNTLVAVINNYFRSEFDDLQDRAASQAEDRAQEMVDEALSEGFLAEDVTYETTWTSSDQDYLDWSFYILSSDSIANMYSDGVSFRAAPLIDRAKQVIDNYDLWDIGITTKTSDGIRVAIEERTRYVEKEVQVQATDENGDPAYDSEGNPIYETTTELVPEQYEVEVEYPTRHITVEYFAHTKPEGKDYIIEASGLSDEKDFGSDISDKELVEEEVAQMRILYSTAIGDLVASGQILDWIQSFYADHSDLVFNGPSAVAGPVENWRALITSHQGATDIPEHEGGHNGLDISSPNGTPLVLPSDGVIVQVTNAYPNVKDYSVPRGNLVFVYYGEQNGEAGKGIFVLYQHLSSAPVSPYEKYSAGETIAASGQSGMSTGPHWHVEVYIGTTKVDPESFLL